MKQDSNDQNRLQSVQSTVPMEAVDPSQPKGTAFNRRMARVSALGTLAVVFAGIGYSREMGFLIYAFLFAIPYVIFVLSRSSRKWQAWGWSLACVILALALIQVGLTTLNITRRVHRSDVIVLVFCIALLLTLAAQLFFVRRVFTGKISYGTPLFRATLYYLCLLILLGATLPNWYVPARVRRENGAAKSLREYSAAMDLYASRSNNASYPLKLSALAAPEEAGKSAPLSVLASDLMCAQASCTDNGYRFEYRPLFVEGRVASYTISARPLEFEDAGSYNFLLAADGKIHETREDREALLTDSLR